MSSESSTIDWRFVTFGYVYLTVQNILSTLIGVLGYSFLTRSISQVDVGVYDVALKVFSVLVAFTVPFLSALFPYYGSV